MVILRFICIWIWQFNAECIDDNIADYVSKLHIDEARASQIQKMWNEKFRFLLNLALIDNWIITCRLTG